MKFVPSKPVLIALAAIALLLGFWGYCFELAYFARLGLNVHKLLTLPHFVVSGAANIVPMLIALLILANVKRFFTKSIHTDPIQQVVEELESTTFDKQLSSARLGAAFSGTFLVLVVGLPALGLTYEIWASYQYMEFIVLQSFLGTMLTSPPHARAPVVLVFALSVAACFAGGGYGHALAGQSKASQVIRDDMVVKVTIGADKAPIAEPKPMPIPTPPSLKFLERLIGT